MRRPTQIHPTLHRTQRWVCPKTALISSSFLCVKKVSQHSYVGPVIIAWIYCHLGDRDNGFIWLNKAYDQRACTLSFGLGAPLYDVIRDDSRFGELLTKLRLD